MARTTPTSNIYPLPNRIDVRWHHIEPGAVVTWYGHPVPPNVKYIEEGYDVRTAEHTVRWIADNDSKHEMSYTPETLTAVIAAMRLSC